MKWLGEKAQTFLFVLVPSKEKYSQHTEPRSQSWCLSFKKSRLQRNCSKPWPDSWHWKAIGWRLENWLFKAWKNLVRENYYPPFMGGNWGPKRVPILPKTALSGAGQAVHLLHPRPCHRTGSSTRHHRLSALRGCCQLLVHEGDWGPESSEAQLSPGLRLWGKPHTLYSKHSHHPRTNTLHPTP